ncbi:CGH_3_collapsed_G0025350.mRNA.1.CDS.1 [Saccharomyces cerevisiae]|nr:CGH_3_collapsed_G0025350.mRNA.1.CDS.1 [Saccharomyces cerevisiae]
MGYDICQLRKVVWPTYGYERGLLCLDRETHKLGKKFITDLVINHCSSEHEWFKEQILKTNQNVTGSSETSHRVMTPKASQILQTIEVLLQWLFMDSFTCVCFATQPDLNWENEDCRKAIYESAVGYWLDHGVDGFRIDVGSLYPRLLVYQTLL